MTQRSGLSLQQLLTDRNLALQPCESMDTVSDSCASSNVEDHPELNLDNGKRSDGKSLFLFPLFNQNNSSVAFAFAFAEESSMDAANEIPDGNTELEPETISAARTRALPDHNNHRNLQIQQQQDVSMEEHDRLLKDVAAAADICRCNPCRCDPLLNDCSVSCNPVVDSSADPNQPAGGCSCGCSKNESAVANKASRMGGCGCSCGTSASSSLENTNGQLGQLDQLPALPYHPQESLPCSEPLDSDPCCIVVCLKHLKRQYLIDRPKCCA